MVENPETVTLLDEVKKGRHRKRAERSAAARGHEAELNRSADRAGQDRALRTSSIPERLREQRDDVDQEALRQICRTLPTLHWMLDITSGFKASPSGPRRAVWHEDVMFYDVDDAATGERIAGI